MRKKRVGKQGHKRGRLSLPAIRISGPEGGPARSPLSSSTPLQPIGSSTSGGEGGSRSARHSDWSSDDERLTHPSRPLSASVPPGYRLQSTEAQKVPEVVAIDPALTEEMQMRIKASMDNCREYERKCALLEHNIEHKILLWTDVLDKYEIQDATATELRESIAASLQTLSSVQGSIVSCASQTDAASSKLAVSQKTLERASAAIQGSRDTMVALEEFMGEEEIKQRQVIKLQRALLGTIAGLVAVIAIFWVTM